MDKGKAKKGNNLIIKTWERCKSIGRGSSSNSSRPRLPVRSLTTKSKSWPSIINHSYDEEEKRKQSTKRRVAPEGCFSVYVGPQKQRFVIKTEYANHPLFKVLLEEAESEYGFISDGPLVLPCNVDLFCKVLLAMDDQSSEVRGHGCGGFAKGYQYHHLAPPRMVVINQF